VEGDALFVYAPANRVQRGETLLELIESTYVAFRDRLAATKRHTTCGCVACNAVQSLDLKFFTHFGEYVPQRIAGEFKLIGSDINLVHRLVKNSVKETKGWRGYALFTDAALNQLGIRPADSHTSTERYEHLGEVVTHSYDLHRRHQELTEARRVFITAAEADVVKRREFLCPPPVLWEWLNDPHKRASRPDRAWSDEPLRSWQRIQHRTDCRLASVRVLLNRIKRRSHDNQGYGDPGNHSQRNTPLSSYSHTHAVTEIHHQANYQVDR
jgi:hypothetical protein